jgi:hypothetical protein
MTARSRALVRATLPFLALVAAALAGQAGHRWT